MANPDDNAPDLVVPSEVVDATIDHFTALDQAGDRRTMNKMARRLGKEQPALLRYAAGFKDEHGEDIGEAAVFYCTLVWAIFDRQNPRKLPRLTQDNIAEAGTVIDEELGQVEGIDDLPVHERIAPGTAARQPHLFAKLQELIEDDVREDAMTEECAGVIIRPTQVMIEAFDAAVAGRRPGERQGPVVRETPKVGRNEPCPCGSGKKYKKCHGKAA